MGLTQQSCREHICRAMLEAICFQTRDILEAMQADSKVELTSLVVDGGNFDVFILVAATKNVIQVNRSKYLYQ